MLPGHAVVAVVVLEVLFFLDIVQINQGIGANHIGRHRHLGAVQATDNQYLTGRIGSAITGGPIGIDVTKGRLLG